MVRSFLTDDDRHARLDDSCLVRRYLVDSVAKRLHVVETDGSDGTNGRRHDVRGVDAAAHADLKDYYVALQLLEVQERHQRANLEKCERHL